MQYSISHLQARVLALVTAMATALAVLSVMAAYAAGESTEVADAAAKTSGGSSPAVEIPVPVEEASASEQAPAPSAEAAPEPTSPAPVKAGIASTETTSPDLPQAVSGATSQVSGATSQVSEAIGTSRTSEVVETVSHDTVEATTRVIESVGSSKPIVEVGKTGSQVLDSAGDSLRSTSDSLGEVGRNALEAGGGGAESTLHGSTGSSPASPTGDAGPKGGLGALSGSDLLYVAGPGGIEPLQLSSSDRSVGSVVRGHPPLMPNAGAKLLSNGGGGVWANRPAPSDSSDGNGPSGPPSQTSPTAASGLGGSFFVPIAALLALLALVAPAITRRFRERVDLSPPLPFACALERPG
jgi:hypothetical protein